MITGARSPEIASCLQRIGRIFDIEAVLQQRVDHRLVIEYYTQSARGYRLFHSRAGAVHMALNPDGAYDATGFYGQATVVQRYIDALSPVAVLELASGQGFNTIHLAGRNPDLRFTGLDLTPAHVLLSQRRSATLPNASFEIGDFQHLPFAPGSFDLVFVVEGLCHASDVPLALSQARDVLRPGGLFVVIDGYRLPGFGELPPEVRTAALLAEASMAVGSFQVIDDWLYLARSAGFELCDVQDLTAAIMPTLHKQRRLAELYFRSTFLSRLVLRLVPPLLVRNSIAGLLMPLTVQAGAHGYYAVALQRP